MVRSAALRSKFDFGEGHFDRVEVGRIGRQVEQDGACGLDERTHTGDFVGGQVVHDDDVALGEGRNQFLFEPGQKDFTVHRTIEDVRRGDGVVTQARDKSRRLPMAVRRSPDQPLAEFAAPAQARHRGVRAGFVDENDFVGIKRGLILPPGLPRQSDVGAKLLAGVKAFF